MRKKLRVIVVCIIMLLTVMPTSVFATDSDWTYDPYGKTLSKSDGTITLYNVSSSKDNLLTIGRNAESELTSIDMTGTITDRSGKTCNISYIDSSAFFECTSLESVNLPDSLTGIGNNAFARCSNLKEVNIADGLKSIEVQAFLECTSLVSINLPDSLEEIEKMAFANCKAFTSIEIPANVTGIGELAFAGCSNLKTVILHPVRPPFLGDDAFKYLPDDFLIIVPRESYNKYMSYVWWDDYSNRIRIAEAGIGTPEHDYEDGKCIDCGALDPDFVCEIIMGANGIWQKGSTGGLSFTSNAAYDDFLKVQIDGKDLDSSNYTVKEGSTIVTLKASYLETLSAGKHDLAIVSETGTAATEFTVKGAAATGNTDSSAETGDELNILFCAVFAALAAAGAAGIIICGRRREHDM